MVFRVLFWATILLPSVKGVLLVFSSSLKRGNVPNEHSKSLINSSILCNHKEGNTIFFKFQNGLHCSLHGWRGFTPPFARGGTSPCAEQGLVSSRIKNIPSPPQFPFKWIVLLYDSFEVISTFSRLTAYFISSPLGLLFFP